MFQNLSKREKRLALITLVVVLAATCYHVLFQPHVSRLWQLRQKAAELQIQIVEMERALTLGDRIERRYRDYEAAISQKGTDLEESTAFLRTLADVTEANEMKVIRQEHLPIQLGSYYKIFSVRLGVTTRPVWLARFLARLQERKELIRVEDIIVKALDDSETLSVNMKLSKVVAAERQENQ